jgi:site-specific DNA-methyltransferase (adenine-specific)
MNTSVPHDAGGGRGAQLAGAADDDLGDRVSPYYEQDGIVIYQGDSALLVPSMVADVLVTDPPYGVEFDGKATKHTVQKSGGYTTEDSAEVGPLVVGMALERVGRGLVFPGIRNLHAYPVPADIGCVYCPSGAGIGRWGFTCFHPVLFYGPRANNVLRPSSIQSFATSERNGHPCPKPVEWMLWAVDMVSNPGDLILDPFMGSGTTLVAAKRLGRRAIGIEREQEYCDIAIKRLAQSVLQLEYEPPADVPLDFGGAA